MAYQDVRGPPPSPSSPDGQELLALRERLARQREEIDALAARLGRRDVECVALRTEKAVLVDELARANKKLKLANKDERPTGESKPKEADGPIKQLVDLNAALTAENARLQAVVDVTRKSFKAHIRGSRKRREEDRQTIEALRRRREDKVLQRRGHSEGALRTENDSSKSRSKAFDGNRALRRLSSGSSSERAASRAEHDPSRPHPKGLRRSLSDNTTPSERTAGTFRSSFTESADDSHRRVSEVSSGTSGDDWIDEREEEEAADADAGDARVRKGASRGPSDEDAGRTKSEDSGAGKAPRNKWTGRRHTVQEGDGARTVPEADDLLVDFGEARRWSGLKW